MKLKEFNQAIKLLEIWIEKESHKVPYSVCDNAPNTFNEMVRSYKANKIFFVNGEASDTTIYSHKRYNIMFRAIHDKMHYNTGLTFSFEDEKTLSDVTEIEFRDWAIECGYIDFCPKTVDNVCKIIEAEIKGQIEYYEKYKKYIDNQKEFVLQYLKVTKERNNVKINASI